MPDEDREIREISQAVRVAFAVSLVFWALVLILWLVF